jgi:hypothetical protein
VIAEDATENFRKGECQYSDFDFELAFRKGEPESSFEWRLDQVVNDEEEALEFLSGIIDLEEDPGKTKKILAKLELQSPEILRQWYWQLIEFDNIHCSVFAFVPLLFNYEEAGWAIIEQSGPGLDPEYDLVGVFEDKEKMTSYFWDHFES